MRLLQVTIPSSGVANLGNAGNGLFNGLHFQQATIQNNTAGSIGIGDSTVSATKGILLAAGTPGSTLTSTYSIAYAGSLNEWYAYNLGTSAATLDILILE